MPGGKVMEINFDNKGRGIDGERSDFYMGGN
jgi:hypothetical protein